MLVTSGKLKGSFYKQIAEKQCRIHLFFCSLSLLKIRSSSQNKSKSTNIEEERFCFAAVQCYFKLTYPLSHLLTDKILTVLKNNLSPIARLVFFLHVLCILIGEMKICSYPYVVTSRKCGPLIFPNYIVSA